MIYFAVGFGIPVSVCGIPVYSDMLVHAHLIKPSVRNTLPRFRPLALQLLEDAGSRGMAADVVHERVVVEKKVSESGQNRRG